MSSQHISPLDDARRRRWAQRFGAGLLALYAVAVALVIVGELADHRLPALVIVPTVLIFVAGAIVAGAVASVDRRLSLQARHAWRLMTVSYVLALLGNVLFVAAGSRLPSWTICVRIVPMAVMFAALLTFPVRAAGRRERLTVAIDAGIVLIGGAMLMWYVVLGQHAKSQTSAAGFIEATLMPAANLALIFGLVRLALRGAESANRRWLVLLAVGTLMMTSADVYSGYLQLHGKANAPASTWQMTIVMTMELFFVLAPLQQMRQAADSSAGSSYRVDVVSRLPFAAIWIGYAPMVVTMVVNHQIFLWGGLVVGGFTITTLVVLRQFTAQLDSQEKAVTDSLTGLANRPRLYDYLARALERAERKGSITGVLLIDLNKFKHVNDTYGHTAGDRLLVHFAGILRRSIFGADLAARLGGDEFAVVLCDLGTPENAAAVVRRIIDGLTEPLIVSEAVLHPQASIGVAVSHPGQLSVGDLIRHADEAMYEAKRSRLGSAFAMHADERTGHNLDRPEAVPETRISTR